ncbi:flagella basal body P-ring formation protein FlgA [Sphingobium sp. B11D3B]|nr:flagella basal body P-ring formation protein FlgA [Sphingobium sp. B11D3B]
MTIERLTFPKRAALIAALLLGAMALASIHAPAKAQIFENLDRLDSLVAASLGANLGQPGGPLAPIDRRLKLAPCPQTPTVETPQMNAATVACPSLGWRIRVPLLVNRQVGNPQQNGRFSEATSSAPVVKKGDPVQLVAGNESFSISRMMIADEDGAPGALIRVREEPRATPVMARVERTGVVRIPGI